MIPPRISSAAQAARNSRQRLSRWFVFFALLFGTAFDGQAEIGLAESPLFTIDTTYVASVGVNNSSLFTLDTRYGLGTAAKDSQGFTLDTRFSAGTGIGQSSGFTLDTLNASIADVLVTGRVTDTTGIGLGSAVVQASLFNRIQASAAADAAGNYTLPAIPAGTYQFRAIKYPYITGVRVGQSFSPGQSATENFSLALLPAPPPTEVVNRTPIAPPPSPTPAQLKVWNATSFVSGLSLNPDKMTIVLTHGLISRYTDWPTTMAGQLRDGPGNISANANIVAWDWDSGRSLSETDIVYSRIPAEGEALGVALYRSLGANYSKPIHFIGHSFGTMVNAGAANYLHAPASPDFESERTHLTLLDNAEAWNGVNNAGQIIEATAVDVLQGGDAASSLLMNAVELGGSDWVSPVPRKSAWVDNFISEVGISVKGRGVNVYLAQSAVFAGSLTFAGLHSYAHEWYGKTILTPYASVVGHRDSFERLGEGANLADSPPWPLGWYFDQDNPYAELSIQRMSTAEQISGRLGLFAKSLGKVTVTEVKATVVGTVKILGNVVVSVVEKTKSSFANLVNSLPSTSLLVGPIFAADAVNVASLHIELQNSTGGQRSQFRRDGGDNGSTNMPAYAWFTLAVPSNAVSMTFDFQLHGDGANDCLIFGIQGTNVFTLETRFIPQEAEQNSGAINVRPWAGTNAEFFVGLSGGTSSNATVAVDGIRFYAEVPPVVQAQKSGNQLLVLWPLGAGGYTLESALNFDNPNGWSAVTNAPGLFDFQYAVTNSIDSDKRFFRLRKQ